MFSGQIWNFSFKKKTLKNQTIKNHAWPPLGLLRRGNRARRGTFRHWGFPTFWLKVRHPSQLRGFVTKESILCILSRDPPRVYHEATFHRLF
jgi:hypothetical protein